MPREEQEAGKGVGVKSDDGKPRFDLVPTLAIAEVTQVFAYGADKYKEPFGDPNWMKGMRWGRMYASAMRHLMKWWFAKWLRRAKRLAAIDRVAVILGMEEELVAQEGDADPEHGLSHLAAAGCCVLMLLHYEQFAGMYDGYDDRPDPHRSRPKVAVPKGPRVDVVVGPPPVDPGGALIRAARAAAELEVRR